VVDWYGRPIRPVGALTSQPIDLEEVKTQVSKQKTS
jgi:hypothetical protein